jgi:hypothetical protein
MVFQKPLDGFANYNIPLKGRVTKALAASLRHCERSEAIQSFFSALDCFVALLLAMTEEAANTPRSFSAAPEPSALTNVNSASAITALTIYVREPWNRMFRGFSHWSGFDGFAAGTAGLGGRWRFNVAAAG